jgi:hypothetical protein
VSPLRPTSARRVTADRAGRCAETRSKFGSLRPQCAHLPRWRNCLDGVQLAGAPTTDRRQPNRLFASPSMKRCSTLRRNRIIPALTTTHGSLDQIPTTDFPRRHRTDGRPPWSTTRRRSGTSCRWWTLRPDTSNRTHSSDAECVIGNGNSGALVFSGRAADAVSHRVNWRSPRGPPSMVVRP